MSKPVATVAKKTHQEEETFRATRLNSEPILIRVGMYDYN